MTVATKKPKKHVVVSVTLPTGIREKLEELQDDLGSVVGPTKPSPVIIYLIEQEHARRHPAKGEDK